MNFQIILLYHFFIRITILYFNFSINQSYSTYFNQYIQNILSNQFPNLNQFVMPHYKYHFKYCHNIFDNYHLS